MKKRTPQEKKFLSYEKDRRNAYGENDKASRKSVRRNKILPNRAFRKQISQVLQEAIGETDFREAELLDNKAKSLKRRNWKKFPDISLRDFVKRQRQKREVRIGGKLFRKKVRNKKQFEDEFSN